MPKILVLDYWEVHALPDSVELEVTDEQLSALQRIETRDGTLRDLVRSHGSGLCVDYSHLDEASFKVLSCD